MRRSAIVGVVLFLAVAAGARADAVLFSNGPMIDLPFGGSGGAHASRALSRLTYGGGWYSPEAGQSLLATVVDDFLVPGPLSWNVTKVVVFCTDEPYAPVAAYVTLWSAPPWQTGASVLFTATASQATPNFLAYRVPASNTGYTGRPIRSFVASVNWTLASGRYWLGWQPAVSPTSKSGEGVQSTVPPVTIPGQAATGDGRWFTRQCYLPGPCDPPVWYDAVDGSAPQGFPFVLRGGPVAARKGDMGEPSGPDLLFRNVNPASADYGRHKLWLMNGVARADEAYIVPDLPGPSWEVVGSDDFDTAGAPWNGPDGRSDLLVRDSVAGVTQLWLMNGAARVGSALPLSGALDPVPDWKVAATADFDGDSRPDIVWRNSLSQELVVWAMNASAYRASLRPTPDHAVDANWTLIGAQDYNNDGATDFLWYNETSGKIVTWYLNASLVRISGQFATPPQAGDNNWKVVASGDYSGDAPGATPPVGSPDVVWRNATSGNLVIWHLDFASTRVRGEFTSPTSNTPALDWVVAGPR